jgi:hypothetical protein
VRLEQLELLELQQLELLELQQLEQLELQQLEQLELQVLLLRQRHRLLQDGHRPEQLNQLRHRLK